MNLLNVALGGIAGSIANSLPAPIAGIAEALLTNGGSSGSSASAAATTSSRDSLISALPDILGSVNSLAQAASQTSGDTSDQLTLPPLPQMPAPAPAPAVPTDDNGQSNIVLQDSASDASLIH